MNKIKEIIQSSIDVKQQVLHNEELLKTVEKVIETITDAFKKNKRVYFCGNGGSAADAQHLAAEFSGRFYLNRKALPAEACYACSQSLWYCAQTRPSPPCLPSSLKGPLILSRQGAHSRFSSASLDRRHWQGTQSNSAWHLSMALLDQSKGIPS